MKVLSACLGSDLRIAIYRPPTWRSSSALARITYSWRKCPTFSDLLQSQSLVGEHAGIRVTYIIFSLISIVITRTKILNITSVIFSTFRIYPYLFGQIMWTPCRSSGSDSQFTLKGISARADSLFAFCGPILLNIYPSGSSDCARFLRAYLRRRCCHHRLRLLGPYR